MRDPTGTYSFTFDGFFAGYKYSPHPMGRLAGTTASYSFLTGRTFTTSYAYDAASNRVGFTDPEGGSTAYVYDTLNRMQTLTAPAAISSGSFGFGYDALSRRTSLTRPNAVNTTYSYDNLSRLLSVVHAKGGTTLDGATYTVDSAGNRTAKADLQAGVSTTYGYDAIYQLLSATKGGSTSESYTYDPVGNRQSSLGVASYSYNPSNELTSTSSATYGYDNNGNAVTKNDSTGITTYAWDFENRLTSATLSGSAGTVSFKYDPFGRRIYKSSSTATSVFAYDGDNLIEETNASGTAVARYSQGLNIDEPLAMLRSGTTSYYNADGLGSITSLANGSGALAQTYTFDSFGRQTGSSGSLTNPFQYTGRESDSETGLYYYRARYYDAGSGRFLTADPLEFAAGVNFYSYVDGNPANAKDPFGLWSPTGHDQILAHALAGCASECEIQRLQKASRDFDKRTGGAIGFSPLHSMRTPVQSPSDAKSIRDGFIQATLAQASAAEAAGINGQALDLLAEALHPLMDSTSLLHTDPNGNPLPWNGLKSVDDYFHSPGDWWGAETSGMLAFGFPRFNKMESRIRSAYMRVMGRCKSSH